MCNERRDTSVMATFQSQDLKWSGRKLGNGRYGCEIEKVYVGECPYACKFYNKTVFKNDDFLKEFKTQYVEYRKLQHKNLLRIKGVCEARGDAASPIKVPCILFELMETDLFQRISGDSAEKLPMSVSLRILTEISQGLKFLHEKDFVHKKLSSSSILVDDQNHVKIGGFPFIFLEPDQARRGKRVFMAPEVISSSQHGKPADLYSYACIALHLMSQELPEKLPKTPEGSGPGDDIHKLVQEYLENVPVPVASALQNKVVEPCLCSRRTDRPNIVVVSKAMVDITVNYKKDKESVQTASVSSVFI